MTQSLVLVKDYIYSSLADTNRN